MSLEPGTQVGRYRVSRLIAQGGMAEVYRAEQELTAGIYRPAALKVIRPEYSESSDFREMFLDEARTACTLSHPNIVHIYEVGEADGRLYMAMELVPGESLSAVERRLHDAKDRFTDEALLSIGIAVCSALEMVHALQLVGSGHVNLVHRDVSPHNLLLGPSGSLKLIDFGIAKAATNRNLTLPGVTKGKAGYFSPEQAMGKTLDGRSDLFSLGVTLYKLASGVTPFDEHKTHMARNSALVHGKWEPLAKVCPGLPAGLYEVVNKALALKRDDRWADAREMREALENVAVDAGLRVGQGMMAGYALPDEADESSLTATPIRTASGVRRPSPGLTRQITDKVRRTREWWRRQSVWGAIALAAIAAIVGVQVLMRLRAPPTVQPGPRVAAVRPARAASTPPPPAVSPVAPEPLAPEPPKVVASAAPPPVQPAPEPPKPRAEKRIPKKPAPSRPAETVVAAAPPALPPKPAEPEPEPGGSGKVTISIKPHGEYRVGDLSGMTPQVVSLASGRHTVQLTLPSGEKQNCSIKVFGDKTTYLVLDSEVRRCETSYR